MSVEVLGREDGFCRIVYFLGESIISHNNRRGKVKKHLNV